MPNGRKVYAGELFMRNETGRESQKGYEEEKDENELPLSWR